MGVNLNLPESGKNDFIILEEEYFSKGMFFGIINQGGSINIGNFALMFEPDGTSLRLELRYVPKGNFHKPESFVKKKPKPSKAKKVGEVLL